MASVQIQSAQQKPARSQAPKDTPASGAFGSLVDSNTQAIGNNAPAQDSAPRRSEQTSSSPAAERPSRDTPSTDQASQSKASDDADPSAAAENDRGEAPGDPAKGAGKVKDKTETADAKSADKSDETESDTTHGTEVLTAAADAAAGAPPATAQTALPDPGIIVAAPVVPVDPNAAANQAGDAAAAPLAIAAAGLAASASTAAQIAGTKTDTATTSDKSAKASAQAAGAEVDAETTTTLGEAAAGTTETASTGPKAGGGLMAAVSQGTPKTAFKDAATAQAQTDVSNIGQDTGKANLATAQAPAPTANAAHAQGLKPQADSVATEAKAGAADRAADPAQGAPAASAHAGALATPAPTDTSAQAASAVQAPLTNTTSAATASTATLTATAATHNAAVPISGIPIEIAAAIRAGKSRFDISLDPAELGRIDVRINVDRTGNVTSHLTVEKPETLQMLRQDAPQLQRALDDAGFKTGSNGLSFSLRDQNSSGQNSGQNNDNGGNARRLIISEDDSVPAAPIGRGYGRMLGSSSGVDIRV
uniref:flagellar hook-length control protein FliK n=1 Tax=Bradyrhizobium glycinis TaxID=2751812 RepID=UPI00289B8FAF|nr:flagellar hook-length control protein FliK [Bradyrhizobium glycinis]